MKFIYKFLSFLLIGFLILPACDKKLDLKPLQSIDSEAALNTSEDVITALVGAYSIFRGGVLLAVGGVLGTPGSLYGGDLLLAGDLLAGDGEIRWNGTFAQYRDILNKGMVAENPVALSNWAAAYHTINSINNVLAAVDKVVAAERNTVRGEALWMRGVLYFELVRFYAQPWDATGSNNGAGVPIVLNPTKSISAADFINRSTIAEVYARVIADLTEAKSLLPNNNGLRANTFTASAFLARVYLQQSNFAGALAEANLVIGSGKYSLNANVTTAFAEDNSPEGIFEIQQNAQNNAGQTNFGLATFYANLLGTGRGDIEILPGHTGLYGATDRRLTDLIYTGTGLRPGRLTSGKWTDPTKNIPIVRLAEMLLIRAECNSRLGSATGDTPLADVNRLRTRANLTSLLAVTLNDILAERRLELAFEGARIHDLKRLKQNVGARAFNDPKLVFPIPRRDIDINANLVQNPTY